MSNKGGVLQAEQKRAVQSIAEKGQIGQTRRSKQTRAQLARQAKHMWGLCRPLSRASISRLLMAQPLPRAEQTWSGTGPENTLGSWHGPGLRVCQRSFVSEKTFGLWVKQTSIPGLDIFVGTDFYIVNNFQSLKQGCRKVVSVASWRQLIFNFCSHFFWLGQKPGTI